MDKGLLFHNTKSNGLRLNDLSSVPDVHEYQVEFCFYGISSGRILTLSTMLEINLDVSLKQINAVFSHSTT